MRRAERLFRIVRELRSQHVTRAADLAARLEISVRSIYRDIAHLQGSGLPIEGESGVGYLLRPGFDLPAMTFTFEQLDALAMGLSFVETAGDEALAEAAAQVRAKLQGALPDPEHRALVEAPFFASRRDGRAGRFAATVRRAIRGRHVLLVRYNDGAGASSNRRVQPLALWAASDGWVFAAWCELRHDFRAFRIDRVETATETGDRFDNHPERDLRAFLAAKQLPPLPPTPPPRSASG